MPFSASFVIAAFAFTLPFWKARPPRPASNSIPKSPVGFSTPLDRWICFPTSRIIRSSSRSVAITWLRDNLFFAALPLAKTTLNMAGSYFVGMWWPPMIHFSHVIGSDENIRPAYQRGPSFLPCIFLRHIHRDSGTTGSKRSSCLFPIRQ